ncbi:GNAT family N-acetyltransferase [Streptomyces polyrhachis]|uniref:GNAT family N-acetyltransferase n=1 Tax=Streptomyces polyrhachis TaxID=1282885 RepID=A0ABW2GHA4_9ACTN
MNEELLIREAVPSDTEGVRAVGLAAWPPTYTPLAGARYVESRLAVWWSTQSTARGIAAGNVLVAEVAGGPEASGAGSRIVGMAGLGERGGVPVLWKLYVLPSYHGRGVGSALMAAVRARLKAAGAERLHLEYMAGNERAAAFYRAQGFREFARTPDPDHPELPDDVWMEAAL